MFDSVFNGFIALLVKVLLNPKEYFEDSGQHKALIEEPSIIVCNHTGHLDGPVVNTVFRRNVIHNLAAKDRFEQRGFGFFLRHTGCIPIDRQHADTSWIHTSLSTLRKDRECVAIYPEGRHGTHRNQLPFHSGVTTLAAIARVPIVMVYLDGPFRFFHGSSVMISRPFRLDAPSEGMTAEYVEKQTAILQSRMKSLMDEFVELTSSPRA